MPSMFYLVWIVATAAYALVGPMPLPATTEKVPAILLRGNQSGKKCLKYTNYVGRLCCACWTYQGIFRPCCLVQSEDTSLTT